MLKIKPEIWTRNGREQFVVLSMRDFERVQELIEDAGLSRILRDARRNNAKSPGVPLEQMMRKLGMKPTSKVAKAG